MDLRSVEDPNSGEYVGPETDKDKTSSMIPKDLVDKISRIDQVALGAILEQAQQATGKELEWVKAGVGADKVVLFMREKPDAIAQGFHPVSRSEIPSGRVEDYVYMVPRDVMLKQTAETIRSEYDNFQELNDQLKKVGISLDDSNIASKWERMEVEGRGVNIFRSDKGVPLEKAVQKHSKIKNPNVRLAALLSSQSGFFKGVSNCHKAGKVIGDIKLDNAIEVEKPVGDKTVKETRLIDLGKAKTAPSPGAVLPYVGNPRAASPEFRLSKESDVWAAAVTGLQILESGINVEGDSLIPAESGKYSSMPAKGRWGFEKWLCADGSQTAFETKGWAAFSQAFRRLFRMKSDPPSQIDLTKQEKRINEYIDAIQAKWEQTKLRPEDRHKLMMMTQMYRGMLRTDPKKRLTMDQVTQLMGHIENGDATEFAKTWASIEEARKKAN